MPMGRFGTEDGWGQASSVVDEAAATTAFYSSCKPRGPVWFGGGDAIDSEVGLRCRGCFHK